MDDFDNTDLSALFAEVDQLEARSKAPESNRQVSSGLRRMPAVLCMNAWRPALEAGLSTEFSALRLASSDGED